MSEHVLDDAAWECSCGEERWTPEAFSLGLREERGLDIHGPNPQRRFVTDWEDVSE